MFSQYSCYIPTFESVLVRMRNGHKSVINAFTQFKYQDENHGKTYGQYGSCKVYIKVVLKLLREKK